MSSEAAALLLVKFYVGCRLLLPRDMAMTRAIYVIVLSKIMASPWPQRPQRLLPVVGRSDYGEGGVDHGEGGTDHSEGDSSDYGEGGIDAVD